MRYYPTRIDDKVYHEHITRGKLTDEQWWFLSASSKLDALYDRDLEPWQIGNEIAKEPNKKIRKLVLTMHVNTCKANEGEQRILEMLERLQGADLSLIFDQLDAVEQQLKVWCDAVEQAEKSDHEA
jgi:hypothetical protein